MLLGANLMWKQLFVKPSFIIWWESSKDYEIFTKWQNALMFLKIIIEFSASQPQFCRWGIDKLSLYYFLLLPWASSVTTLINILLPWGARGWVTRRESGDLVSSSVFGAPVIHGFQSTSFCLMVLWVKKCFTT